MQTKFPVISNNFVEDEFNIVRIEPSKMAIGSLNALQNTEWAINEHIIPTVKQVMQIFVKERIQDLFELEMKGDSYVLNMKSFPVLTLGQIRHWNSSPGVRAAGSVPGRTLPPRRMWRCIGPVSSRAISPGGVRSCRR